MKLTNSQEIAFSKLIDFVASSERYFKLSGAAGSGKTYLICQFVKYYNDINGNKAIALATPSHKARRNAEKMLLENDVNCIERVTTIASLLGLAPDIDPDNGKEIFTQSKKTSLASNKPPSDYGLIVIDEAWMLDGELIKTIENEIKYAETKIIFVGDRAQLPPIVDGISWLETFEGCQLPFAYLDEVIRYSGDLARIAHTWRVNYELRNNLPVRIDPIAPLPIVATNDQSIVKLENDDFITSYCQDLMSKKDIKLIAWRNKICNAHNFEIRKKLYELDYFSICRFDEFLMGDLLIARRPIERNVKGKSQIIYENSTEFKIVAPSDPQKIELFGTRIYWWKVVTDKIDILTGENFTLNLLSEDSVTDYQRLLNKLATEAKQNIQDRDNRKSAWRNYFFVLKKFDDVIYSYAITNHKAQGSTLDAVYLDLNDLNKCDYKYQAIYTAMTRSKQLYI